MTKILSSRTGLLALRRYMCSKPPAPIEGPANPRVGPSYRPTEFQKTLLVWTKKYKSKEEIPKFVSPELIERTRSEARIKISNYLMLLTALGSICAIFLGKAAAKRGESIEKINQDFHQKYREEYNKTHGITSNAK